MLHPHTVYPSTFLYSLFPRLTYRGISVGGDGKGVENAGVDFLDVPCRGTFGAWVEGMLLYQLFPHHYRKVLLERDMVVLGDCDTPGKRNAFSYILSVMPFVSICVNPY